MFDHLSNQKLIDAYEKAIQLQLEQEFIDLLIEEINDRGINVTE